MAGSSAYMWGAWEGTLDRVTKWPAATRKRLQDCTREVGEYLVAKIRAGIERQGPGRTKFQPLHPWTILLRGADTSKPKDDSGRFREAARTGKFVGERRYIHTGALLEAIMVKIERDRLTARVVIDPSATAPNGMPLAVIAEILQRGAVISVTPAMRGWLHARGLHLKPTTSHIVIPAQPFIEPVYRAEKARIVQMFQRSIVGL